MKITIKKICLLVLIVIILLLITVKVWYDKKTSVNSNNKPTYEELIDGVDIDEIYDYDESDISVDEESGIEYINNILIIMFEDDCSKEKKAEIINSINGKVVGGNSTCNEYYVKIKRCNLDELENICDRLDNCNGVYLSTYEEFSTSTSSGYIPNDLCGY